MKHRWSLALKAQAEGVLEIALYDVVGEGVTAQDVLSQLQGSTTKAILVRINSAGGSVTDGMAIYALLTEKRKAGVKVTARIDGLCASIATLIALAADTVEMAEGAFFMIHQPSSGAGGGTSTDLRSTADLLDRMEEQLLSVYAAKTGKSREELAALCAAETWFDAKAAKAAGFVDTLIPSQALAARWDLTQFHKVPKGLGAIKMTEEECAAMKAELEALRAKNAELEAKLKGKADGDEADPEKPDTETEEDEPTDKASAAAQVVALAQQITGCRDLEALPGALMALSTKSKGTASARVKHAERVAQAISDGKLPPASKDWAMKASAKAFDAFLAGMGENVIAPIGQEHKPGSEAEAKARAGLDASSITLTADELKVAKLMGVPTDKLLEKKRLALAS